MDASPFKPHAVDLAPPSPGARMIEARLAAREHLSELEAALARVVEIASDIANGGVAYPAGVRDVCARLDSDVRARAQTISVILRRTTH